MKNITKLKEAVNNSNMNTGVKTEINNYIKTIMKIHLQVPILYYAAAVYGLASLIVGVIYTMLFVALCGLAVFLIALTGIGEVLWRRYRTL